MDKEQWYTAVQIAQLAKVSPRLPWRWRERLKELGHAQKIAGRWSYSSDAVKFLRSRAGRAGAPPRGRLMSLRGVDPNLLACLDEAEMSVFSLRVGLMSAPLSIRQICKRLSMKRGEVLGIEQSIIRKLTDGDTV